MKLETQKYLKQKIEEGKTPSESIGILEEELGISARVSEDAKLVILNYSQIDSPKTHSIVREARQLILEMNTWDLVSQSFVRFYNFSEALEITEKFDWTNFVCTEKADGSLVSLYWYNDSWIMSTRSTWGDLPIGPDSDLTWKQLFWQTFGTENTTKLNKNYTYVFELCSLHNQNVSKYPDPCLYLLEINFKSNNPFNPIGENFGDLSTHIHFLDCVAQNIGVLRPQIYSLTGTPQEIAAQINGWDEQKEGIVCQDSSGMRLKIKNLSWMALARIKNGGDFTYKNLYDLVFKGEGDELVAYWPQIKEKVETLNKTIYGTKRALQGVYGILRDVKDQKEFAIRLKTFEVPLEWILFECRRHNLEVNEAFRSERYFEKIKNGILNLITTKPTEIFS